MYKLLHSDLLREMQFPGNIVQKRSMQPSILRLISKWANQMRPLDDPLLFNDFEFFIYVITK